MASNRTQVQRMTFIWIRDERGERICVCNPLGDPITLCGVSGWGVEQGTRKDGPATCDQCLAIVRYCQAAPKI